MPKQREEAVEKTEPENYKVRCGTKGVSDYLSVTSPQWEICPICGGTPKECHFTYVQIRDPAT